MSCLLPQFKCQPDTFSAHFRTYLPHASNQTPLLSKNREPVWLRTQCSLSITSPSSSASTSVLDPEKLRLPSIGSHTDSVDANRPWTYTGSIGPPKEPTFRPAFAAETLITSDEAVIAAAGAQAIALAKAALKVAEDAALMVNSHRSEKSECNPAVPTTADAFTCTWSLLTETERADILGDSPAVETGIREQYSFPSYGNESDLLEPTNEELILLQKQLSEGIAVRSTRLTERRARRVRATEKAAASFTSTKRGSASKKKRGSIPEIDHSDPLQYLRATISTSKLLSATEEMKLSEGIQDLVKLESLKEDLKERCGIEPTFAQWATVAGVDQRTLRKRLDIGILSKEKMVKSNIRLVISIVKKYQGAGVNLQDLVQEGCRGLIRGAEKFDPSKGFKFSTYAHWWIKQAVRRCLSDQSRIIRLPFHMVEANYKVKEARKQFISENGRQPTDEEIAKAMGLSMRRLNTILQIPKTPGSLDQKMGYNNDVKPSDILADPSADSPEELMMQQFMKQELEKVLNSLNKKENQVIRWRFGMEDGKVKTLQEIGERLGISRERVRQIELSAFRKLKNKKRSKHLKQYLTP
nr:plastidic RNA polymerase sigma-subunit 2 [Passiflora auriculata]